MRQSLILLSLAALLVGGAMAQVIDNMEYATAAAAQAVYTDASDGGQSIVISSESTIVNQGTYSLRIDYSHDGTQWASGVVARALAVSGEDWLAATQFSIDIYGDPTYAANYTMIIKILEGDGDGWTYSPAVAAFNSATWTTVTFGPGDLADDPWDVPPNPGVMDLSNVIGYQIFLQNIGTTPSTGTLYYDALVPTATGIWIDGSTSDWSSAELYDDDSNADGGGGDSDIDAVYVTHTDNSLYVRVDVVGSYDPSTVTYILYLDTDDNRSTGFNAGWWTACGADYRIVHDAGNDGTVWSHTGAQSSDTWNLVGGPVANVYGSPMELRIPVADLGISIPQNIAVLARGGAGDGSPEFGAAAVPYMVPVELSVFSAD